MICPAPGGSGHVAQCNNEQICNDVCKYYGSGPINGTTENSVQQYIDDHPRIVILYQVTCSLQSTEDMGFLTLSVVFLMAVLQWQTDCYSIKKTVCPPNTHYGLITGCDTTCSSPFYQGKLCTYHEYYGCRCDSGLIPSPAGCVKPEDCEGKCEANMHYEPNASTCQPNCEEGHSPDICDTAPSCVCDDGYIFSNFKCVKKEDCPVPLE
ncbi:zonadhesin-like [Dendrobates tinctorius]|uniref:zonadhesin-like n=1 Tax=Dendrobates tinctorius TaxID=92724 RepID=UPI003CCA495A